MKMPRRPQCLISLDPGLGGTGWALWQGGDVPHAVGIVRDTAKDESLAVRCWELSKKLHTSIRASVNGDPFLSSTAVVIEMPQHMTNARGIAAQAGAIYKLTFLVGYLSAMMYPCPVTVVTPGEWKGQLPKDVVQRRIQAILGDATCLRLNIKSHAWDAVGIALWALGRL